MTEQDWHNIATAVRVTSKYSTHCAVSIQKLVFEYAKLLGKEEATDERNKP